MNIIFNFWEPFRHKKKKKKKKKKKPLLTSNRFLDNKKVQIDANYINRICTKFKGVFNDIIVCRVCLKSLELLLNFKGFQGILVI
jgi:DNA-binding Xre family transcriptional regulator